MKRDLTAADLERREKMTYEEKVVYWEQRTQSHDAHVRAVLKDLASESFDSELKHEVSRKKEGMYFVYAVFLNDQEFPAKYIKHRGFIDNKTKEFADEWRHRIFNYYFGESYKKNKPQLGAIRTCCNNGVFGYRKRRTRANTRW